MIVTIIEILNYRLVLRIKFLYGLGSANAIAFVLGSMFLISKWSAIVSMAMIFGRYLREVVTALELVAAGEETVTVLGILTDVALAPIALIPVAAAAAILAVGALINQWGKFTLKMRDMHFQCPYGTGAD